MVVRRLSLNFISIRKEATYQYLASFYVLKVNYFLDKIIAIKVPKATINDKDS